MKSSRMSSSLRWWTHRTGTATANLQQRIAAGERDRQTDRQTDDIPFHKSCSACYAGSANNDDHSDSKNFPYSLSFCITQQDPQNTDIVYLGLWRCISRKSHNKHVSFNRICMRLPRISHISAKCAYRIFSRIKWHFDGNFNIFCVSVTYFY